MALSYAQFIEDGDLLVRRSHARAAAEQARGAGASTVAVWEWRHGPRPHLDGNAFLVSTGNLRHLKAEQRPASSELGQQLVGLGDEEDEFVDEDECLVEPVALPTAASEAVILELHVVYHATYQTPALYFRAAAVDGTPVQSQRVLQHVYFPGHNDRLPVVASMEQHPVLGTPFSMLHPCETASAMEILMAQPRQVASDESMATYLESWLSLVQPLTGISPFDYVQKGNE